MLPFMDAQSIDDIVRRALAEDVGSGDVTTATIVPPRARAQALITQKAAGVVFGLSVAERVFAALDPELRSKRLTAEGVWREGGEVMAVRGHAAALLTGERTALNFLQRLSGVATLAARCVAAVAEVKPRPPRILDTRKTTPGLRELEKAAAAAGGATNHRAGLYDAILIKENHATIAGGVETAVRRARERAPGLPVEVECRNRAEVDEALTAGAPRLLLDNMSPGELRETARYVGGRAELEASGGVTLETLRDVAGTGVDFISVGAITHSAPALDLSMILTLVP
ncbi:MAG: carboxylating nicotinate-nucleotide diphosphorylase [Candidatus Dormibacteria bacterium]